MKIHTLPLAGIGLSFLAACGDANGDLEGHWEVMSITYEGEEVTEDYVYLDDSGDCTYASRMFMILDRENRGGFFFGYETICPDESESYNYTYGMYVKFQYGWGGWSANTGYMSISCDPPKKEEIECKWGGMKLRFRKES